MHKPHIERKHVLAIYVKLLYQLAKRMCYFKLVLLNPKPSLMLGVAGAYKVCTVDTEVSRNMFTVPSPANLTYNNITEVRHRAVAVRHNTVDGSQQYL